jgi:DinB superfamily
MTNSVSCNSAVETLRSARANALADRLEQGAEALADFARSLSEEQWRLHVPGDGRSIGVIVHHVASVYPVEVHLAQKLAAGLPITGVTMADIHAMNAKHAAEHNQVTRETALELLASNSAAAAAAIRELSDDSLARAATVSLYAGAPLTCQFLLEDHAVRHSYHHLSAIRRTLRS